MKTLKNLFFPILILWAGGVTAQTDYSQHTVFCSGLNVPNQIVFDNSGNLFVANHSYASYSGPYHNTIAKIDPAGNKSVFLSGYTWPSGLAIDLQQNLYMTQNNASSNITKITPAGTATTFASLSHAPGPVTLFDNATNADFAIYTVSHWGVQGIQKTGYLGNHAQFASGSFHGCQLSSDGLYLYVYNTSTGQMFRYNTANAVSELWVSQIQNYEVWASTIGPDNKLYVIGQSNCAAGKKAVYRINGQNSVTEWITSLPGTHEFNDLAFKQNGSTWDLYLSEVAAGGRMDPASNRIIRFTDIFQSGTIQITVNPCNNSLCQGDSATFTATGFGSLPAGTLQWYVNGVPVSGTNLNNGLVGYWPFDGNANDYSGNGNHAVQVQATPTTDRHGNPIGAYNFAGIANPQIIRVPNSATLQFANQATFSLWVCMNSYYGMNGWGQTVTYGTHMLFSKDFDQCCLYEAISGLSNGNFDNGMSTNGWNSGISFSDTVPGSAAGQWYNLTFVFTPTQGKMFANGQLITSKQGTTSFTNSNLRDLYFGRLSSFWYPLNGKLDEVRFYNRALSDAEVYALYEGFDTTFSYIPQNGDTVYCVYTSAGTPTVTDTSNFIIMQVNPLPADIGESPGLGSLQNGLVAWYPFNGNANDYSGNNNHGIYHGTLPVADPCGTSGMAAGFNGSSDWIEVPNSPTLQSPTNAISIAAWVKSTVPYIPFVCKINGPSYNVYQFRTLFNLNDQICTYGMNGQDFNSAMISNPGMNNWFHYMVTYDGNLVRFYINGVPDHQFFLTGGILSNSERMEIGRDAHGPIEWLAGSLDDFRLYNRALTPSEIASIQNGCNFLMVDCINDSLCEVATTNIRVIRSQPSIQYQILKNGLNFGPPQTGNGDTLTFPVTGLAATSNFTIHALNPATGCNRMLDTTLTITVVPFDPAVSADTAVCSGNNVVLEAFGGTGYLWSNGMTGSQITVTPPATTTYYVTVTNAEGCSGQDSVEVTILPGPQPTLLGPAAICLGTNNAIYTTEPGMSNYTWSITGGIIMAGNGTNAVTVTWNSLGPQSIAVNYANAQGCMALSPSALTVLVNPMAAPIISGSTSHCVNSGFYTYSTDPGMNNYQWSVSAGATITWGQGTPDLTVTWDQPGPQWVAVNYTNGSGCTALTPTQLNVTIDPLPGAAGTITGPSEVCAGSTGVIFSTTAIAHADTYVWSLPPGAAIVSGDGTNSITVDFGTNAQSGNITVYGNNVCGNGSPSLPFALSVSPLPGLAGIPVGEEMVCEGDTGMVYYVVPVSNASTYVWEILGGGVITSGNGTNTIHVKFPVAPSVCALTVFGANSCGGGTLSPVLDITVHTLPDTPEISQIGEMLVSSAPEGNQWFFNGTAIPGATGQSYQPVLTGNYTLQVTLFGCVSAMSDDFFYIMTPVTEHRMLQARLWPNPNDGSFLVSLTGITGKQVRIMVINSLGVIVHEQIFASTSSEGDVRINMGSAVPGVYMVTAESDGVTRGVKMVIRSK